MAVINTGLLEKGLRSEFFGRFQGTQTFWDDLATRIPSTSDHEKYAWLGSLPKMREWGSGRLAQGLSTEHYSVENLKYEATIEVDRDEIDDDQTGQIRLRIGEMAEAAATHKDYLIEQLLLNGAVSGFNSYDGVTFFNIAHVSGASGQQSNLIEADAADADVPTTAEFRAAICKAIGQMVAYKDDKGQPIRIPPNPTGFRVIVPPATMFQALEALSLPLAPTAINPIAANVLQGTGQVFVFPGLTDATKFYLAKVDVACRPFIFQDRMPIEFQALAEGSAEEFKKEKYLYGVRARYRVTYGKWFYCVAVTFTE